MSSPQFGQVCLVPHPRKDALIEAVSRRAGHPQKLRSSALFSKGISVVAPRFGGRTVYLWVKNKTRVWVDKTAVWKTVAPFPREFLKGTLLQAEMYRDEPDGDSRGRWIIAFEDILICDGDVIADSKPFLYRLRTLIHCVTQLQRYADPARDPGVFAMKPWSFGKDILDMIRAERFRKQPSYLIARFLPKHPDSSLPDNGLSKETFFLKISRDEIPGESNTSTQTPLGKVFCIHRSEGVTDPDQYDLRNPFTNEVQGKACVRTLHNSLWLRSLHNGARVWCRWLKEHSRYEPYADAVPGEMTKEELPHARSAIKSRIEPRQNRPTLRKTNTRTIRHTKQQNRRIQHGTRGRKDKVEILLV